MKTDKKKNRKSYTLEEKIDVLKVLVRNKYNYLKTERETGIYRSTLKRWEKKHGGLIIHEPVIPEQIKGAVTDKVVELYERDYNLHREDREEIINESFKLQNAILKRLLETIQTEDNIRNLAYLLNVLIPVTIGKVGNEDSEEQKEPINYWQLINNQVIQQASGQED